MTAPYELLECPVCGTRNVTVETWFDQDAGEEKSRYVCLQDGPVDPAGGDAESGDDGDEKPARKTTRSSKK